MSATRKILSGLNADEQAALTSSLRVGDYNLFLGAGISLDATNKQGEDLPSGQSFKDELCQLTKARQSSSLQRVFSSLTPAQIEQHVTRRFVDCEPGPSVAKLPSFLWRRIFTINVDDVLEAAYRQAGNLQTAVPLHFRDPFQDMRTLEHLPIVHLHGWAKEPEKGYVFARSEYARMMADSNAWMTVVADIMPVEPFIIAGTALDEIDLEYYLARRSATTQREDRGPSFFVEPFPDGQTQSECLRYGLHLFHGTMQEFLDELDSLLPERVPPQELVPAETRDLLPSEVSTNVMLSFSNDFERVPAEAPMGAKGIKFSYGNPPEWSDLAAHWDVGRPLATRARSIIHAMIKGTIPERILVICDDTGAGKTTVTRRVGFDLAREGFAVLECSAVSRIDFRVTSEALNLIDEPLVILIDDFAEQATTVSPLFDLLEKRDVVLLCAERNYRQRHIIRSLGDVPYRMIDGLSLGRPEALQLVQSYVHRGLTASRQAAENPHAFSNRLVGEPIAVACCHILSDMRPLDSIVQSTYEAASQMERDRYLVAALAQFCFRGGVRHEILASIAGRERWKEQTESAHPLPLFYVDPRSRNFVVPLNATLAERTLDRAPAKDVAKAFERLAFGIAPRVNRDAIRRRSPEARLAGRLFDYEDVIRRFLDKGAGQFYEKVQSAWQWNSRYWEQVALFHLAQFRAVQDPMLLQQAIQHARHAVAIELHPFPLTTLSKILFAQMGAEDAHPEQIYAEAQSHLVEAIRLERHRGRASVHAYVTLFHGALAYHALGRGFSDNQLHELRDLLAGASRYFPRDKELREISERLRLKL